MQVLRFIVPALLAGSQSFQTASADAFSVPELTLTSHIYNGSSGDSVVDGIHLMGQSIPNPLVFNQNAVFANSICQASYDFAWWDTNGTFLIQSTQAAQGVPTSLLFTPSSGKVYVTPSEDLALSIDASWTYNLPRYYMDTTLLVSVYGVNSHLSLFSQNTGSQTSYPDPASGTVAITGNVVLPPTDTWVLRYEMRIQTFSGTQGTTATGSGYVNFQLSPEPASVALVALGLLILTRCRHHI